MCLFKEIVWLEDTKIIIPTKYFVKDKSNRLHFEALMDFRSWVNEGTWNYFLLMIYHETVWVILSSLKNMLRNPAMNQNITPNFNGIYHCNKPNRSFDGHNHVKYLNSEIKLGLTSDVSIIPNAWESVIITQTFWQFIGRLLTAYRALASMTWVTCSGRQTMILKHMQIMYDPQSASIPYKAWVWMTRQSLHRH